ncbi:MAG: ATP synthase F1 subunit delta [bacterium]|nr:ATP synthase F1 subunit delta [bacterium]
MKVLVQRYTYALILAAKEAKALDAVTKDIAQLERLLTENLDGNEFQNRISSPIYTKAERKEYILSHFQNAHDLTKNFIAMVMDRGREKILIEVPSVFRQIQRMIEGIVWVQITSAKPLSTQELQAFQIKLTKSLNKKVECSTEVDPTLISGVVIEVEGKRFDSSLKRKIEELHTLLIH